MHENCEKKKMRAPIDSPSESDVSERGGSLAMYCRPLSKLFSTIGRLSSSCLLNPRWSSCNAEETRPREEGEERDRVHARVVARLLACTPDNLSRLIHRALNVATKRTPIDVVFIPPRAFVISFDKASLRGADDSKPRVVDASRETWKWKKRRWKTNNTERERKREREGDLQVSRYRIHIYIYTVRRRFLVNEIISSSRFRESRENLDTLISFFFSLFFISLLCSFPISLEMAIFFPGSCLHTASFPSSS